MPHKIPTGPHGPREPHADRARLLLRIELFVCSPLAAVQRADVRVTGAGAPVRRSCTPTASSIDRTAPERAAKHGHPTVQEDEVYVVETEQLQIKRDVPQRLRLAVSLGFRGARKRFRSEEYVLPLDATGHERRQSLLGYQKRQVQRREVARHGETATEGLARPDRLQLDFDMIRPYLCVGIQPQKPA